MTKKRKSIVLASLPLMVLSAMALSAWSGETAADPAELAKTRLAVAREAQDLVTAGNRQGESSSTGEQAHVWSVRLMEAERDLSQTKAERGAAVERHHQRVKEAEDLILRAYKAGEVSLLQVSEAKWRSLEAEQWLAQERAK